MSKHVFKSLLAPLFPDMTITQLNGYWDLAINAQLPSRVFNLVANDLYRLPQVYGAYQQKLGHSPIKVSKDLARRLILEMLIEGPRYLSEIQKLFSIPADLRRTVLSKLIEDGLVCYAFCPIGNRISYFLSPRIRVTGKLKRRIEEVVSCNHPMTLYQISLYVGKCDFSDLCAYAKTVLQDEAHRLEVYFKNGKACMGLKGELHA